MHTRAHAYLYPHTTAGTRTHTHIRTYAHTHLRDAHIQAIQKRPIYVAKETYLCSKRDQSLDGRLEGLELTFLRLTRDENVLRRLHVGAQHWHLDQLCLGE